MREEQQAIEKVNEIQVKITQVEKGAFSAYLREKMRDYNDQHREQFTIKILGNKLQIKYEVFRKIVNQNKPTKKRDCIIAIGALLGWSAEKVNKALNLYRYMPGLDWDNPREYFIVEQLDQEEPITVEEFNRRLQFRGFPTLDIHETRDNKKNSKNILEDNSLPFLLLKQRVRTPITEFYYGDPYDSLGTVYSTRKYTCTADMLIQDKKTKDNILLTTNTDGYYGVQVLDVDILPKQYSSLDDTGRYRQYFVELLNSAKMERKRLLASINDTKNFKIRESARLINDKIHVFVEEFNYIMPELDEYYLLDFYAGKYRLYVYNSSVFMRFYLDDNSYEKDFGKFETKPLESYSSIEKIEELESEQRKYSDNQLLLQMRKRAFIRLKKQVDALYEQLVNKQVFIYRLDDEPGDIACVFRKYHVEEKFNCKYDNEYGEIKYWDEQCEFNDSDEKTVIISYSDLKRAFELGFESINDIIRIKSTLGSVEAVLNM